MAGVFFVEMVAAQRVAPVIAVATVVRVREQHIAILIVADPLAAAFGTSEVLGCAAQTTSPYAWAKRLFPTR
jgi:hypothetical protein